MAQVLAADGAVAGAGFLVAGDILVTCAHVVTGAGSGPGGSVRLVFPHAAGAPRIEGQVLEEPWRAPGDEDVAVVRLSGALPDVEALALGSAEGAAGHKVRSFGFPDQAPRGGHWGYAVAGDWLPAVEGRSARLQLTDANDLTTGFSGGPILDIKTGLVIGMLTEITAPDAYGKGQGIAYVTPVRVLREVWPGLVEQDVCPYQGLEPFTAEQAHWFEGRKDAVRQVIASLARQRRVTLLLGPTGSGKSSLVEAGVLPALAQGGLPGSDRWLQVIARPRQNLLLEIERAGLPGAATDGIAAAVTRRLEAERGLAVCVPRQDGAVVECGRRHGADAVRPPRSGGVGGVQSGWAHSRHGQPRRHGAVVGCGHGHESPPAVRPRRRGVVGGVQSGRAHSRHGQLRPDGAVVGCALGQEPPRAARPRRRGVVGGVRPGRHARPRR